MFLLLIAPHEAGHLSVAKLCRMRVIEFSVGVGPRLLSTLRGGTLYALRLIPIAGYVRISGMEPGTFTDPNSFHRKPAYQRLAVLLAGPLANFLVASLIFGAVMSTQINTGPPGVIAGVLSGSPAAQAGLQPGDRLLSVGGVPVRQSQDALRMEDQHQGEALAYVVRHPDGREETVTIVNQYVKADQEWEIGVQVQPVITPGDVVLQAAIFPAAVARDMITGIFQLVTNQVPGGLLGGEGAAGPIGIGYITAQAADAGAQQYMMLAALLSVALGLANLLPLPVLDGGRIVVVLLEKARGRPFDREGEMAVQRAALAVLLSLVVFLAYFDVQRIANHEFPTFR